MKNQDRKRIRFFSFLRMHARSPSARIRFTLSVLTLIVSTGVIVGPVPAIAASATWTGATDTTWATGSNWSTTPVPGTGDTATFDNIGNSNTNVNLGVGGSVTINTLLFDTANAAAYGIGSGGVGNQTLVFNDSGAITMNAGVASNQVINSALTLGTTAGNVPVTLTDNSGSGATLTIAGNISGGGGGGTKTLTVAGTANTTLSGIIANGTATVALTKNGTGTLTLSGRNTYTGAVTFNGGVIKIQDPTALGSGGGAITIPAGSALQLDGTYSIANAITLNGTGVSNDGVLRNISGMGKFNGNLTANTNPIRIYSDKGILRHGFNSGTIALGANGLTVGGAGDISLFGVISSTTTAGTLTMDGTGMLKLLAANTYTGNTYINNGTVFLSSGETVGTSGPLGKSAAANPGSIVFGGGTMQYSAANTADYSGRFSTAASQQIKIDVSSQAVTFGTALTSAGVTLTLSGATGTLTLNKLLNFAGGVAVNSGSLTLDLNTAAGNNVVAASAALALGGNLNVIGTGGGTLRTQTFSGTTFNPGNATITPTLAAASVLTPALTVDLAGLTRNAGGTSTLILGTVNTTAANTYINTGSGSANALVADANGVGYMAFGTTATSIRDWAVKDAGNTRIIQAPGGFYTAATANSIAGNADIGAVDPVITGSIGDNAVACVRFGNASARTLTLNNNGGGAAVFSVGGILVTDAVGNNATLVTGTGTIRGPNVGAGDLVIHNWDTSSSVTIRLPIVGTGGFTKAGTGLVILSAANTYTGPTTIGGGTLQVGNAGAQGDLGATTGAIVNNGTLTFNRSSDSGVLVVTNNITGTGALIQQGTGTTILTGTSTYRGLTTVNAGTLTFGTGSARKWTSRGNAGSTRSIDGNGVQINSGSLNVAGQFDVENIYITGGALNVLPGGEVSCRNSIGNGFFGLCIGGNEAVGATYGMLNMTGGVLVNINDLTSGQTNPRFGVGIRQTCVGLLRVSRAAVNALVLLANNAEITVLGGGSILTAGGLAPILNTWDGGANGNATCVVNMAGGLFDNGTLGLNIGAGTAGSSKTIINMNDGTLWTQAITQGSGNQAMLNFSGGTLKAGAASATFTPTPAATSSFMIFVNGPFGSYGGGALFDNSNFDVTISTAFLAPTGNGVTSIPLASGGAGYFGAPMVTISDSGATVSGTVVGGTTTILYVTPVASVFVGQNISGTGIPNGAIVTSVDSGTGTVTISQNSTAGGPTTLTVKGAGATAYAALVAGEVSQFVLTNPGVGYVGTVTVTLTGGLVTGGVAAQAGAITVGANTSGGLTKNNGLGKLTLTGTNTYTGTTMINVGTLQVGGGGTTGSLSPSGAIVDNAALIFNRTDTLTQGTHFGTISGPGTFTHAGTGGTVVFNSANTYTGITTISGAAAILLLNNANSLPGGTATAGGTSALTFSGGLLGLGAGDFTRSLAAAGTATAANFAGNGGWAAYGADRVVNLGGASTPITWATANTGFNGAAVLFLGAASATHMVDLQNPLDLSGAARTVQVDNGAADIDAKLSGGLSGNNSLTKTGLGTLWISSDITCSAGTLTLSNGKLILSGNNSSAVSAMTVSASTIAQFDALNSIPGAGRAVTDTGTVAFGPAFGAANLPAALLRLTTGSAGAVAADNYSGENFDFSAAGLTAASLGAVTNVNCTGTLTPNGTTYRLGGGGGTLTYNSALTGAGNALVIAGPGNVVLTQANSHGNGTTVNSGATLYLSGSATLGSTSAALVVNGTLDLGGTSQTVGAVTIGASGIIRNGTLNGTSYGTTGANGNVTAALSGTGTMTVSQNTTVDGTNTAWSGAVNVTANTLTAIASNSLGSGAVTLSGTGNLSLKHDGDGTSSRQTIIYGNNVTASANATITVGKAGVIGNAANKTLQLGTLNIGAQTLTVANNNGYGLEFAGSINLSGAPTLSVGGGSSADVVQGLYLSGPVSGAFGFTKAGTGTLVLTNTASSYGAPSTISLNAGLLSIASDSASGTSLLGAAGNIVSLGAGGGLQANGSFTLLHQLNTGGAAGVIDVTSGNTLTLSSPFNSGAASANSIVKNNNGILDITANNNGGTPYTGTITINAGAIRVSNAGALGAPGNITTVAATGAALMINGVSVTESITINGTGISNAGSLLAVGGVAGTVGALITLGTAPTIGADTGSTLNINNGFSATAVALTFNPASGGAINIGTTAINNTVTPLNKYGSGTVTFNIGTSTAPINLYAGTLVIAGTAQLGITGAITQYTGSTLSLTSTTANRLNGRTLTMFGGDVNVSGAAAETTGLLTVNAGPAVINNTSGATLTLGAATPTRAAGGTALFKGGSTITIGGAPTYIGQTGADNNTAKGIYPWAIFDPGAGSGTSFATATSVGAPYNLRVLNTGTEMVTDAFTLNTNVRLTTTPAALAASTTVNSLTLTAAGSGATLNPGVTLTLDSGGLLNLVNSAGISGGILSSTSNRELLFHTIGDLTIGSAIGGTSGGLTKTGAGTLTLIGDNYFTGQITLNDGSLILSGGNNKVAGNGTGALVLMKPASTLDLGTTSLLVGNISSPVSVEGMSGTITGTGGILTTKLTADQNFSGAFGGSVSFTKAGSVSMLTMYSPSTTTGTLTINAGVVVRNTNQGTSGMGLWLKDGAAFANAGAVNIGSGTLTLDNTGTKYVSDRIKDTATITMDNGMIAYLGRTFTVSEEVLGSVVLNTGLNYLTATTGGSGVNSAQLTLTSLTRMTGAVLNVSDSTGWAGSTGGTFGQDVNGRNKIVVSGGLSGNLATVNGVVPGVFSSGGVDNWNLVGYVGGTPAAGFGALDAAGFSASVTTIVGAGPTSNVKPATLATVAAPQTINSFNGYQGGGLAFSGGTLAGGDLLTVNSGMMIISGSIGFGSPLARGRITSGLTQELFIIKKDGNNNQVNTIHSVIMDNGNPVSLVIAVPDRDGNAWLSLTAPNTYSGGTFVDCSNSAGGGPGGLALDGSAGTITVPAGGLTINNNSRVQMNTNGGQIHSSNIVTLNGGSSLTLVGNNTLAGLVFNSNCGAATPTVSPTGVLTLTGNITSTPSNVQVTPIISGGTLDLGGARNINVAALPAYAPGVGLQISSVIQGGGITKLGTGVLQLLTGANTFTGGLNINAGALLATSATGIGAAANPVTIANNSGLWLNGAVGNPANPIAIAASGGTIASAGGDQSLLGTITLNGPLTVSLADPQLNSTDRSVTIGGNDANTTIAGTGSLVVTGNAGNIRAGKFLYLQNTASYKNTYTGGTTIEAGGRLKLNAAYNMGSLTNSLTINANGAFDLNNKSQTVGNFTGTGGVVSNSVAGTPVLTIGYGNGTGGNFQGSIVNGIGNVALTKVGTGTNALSGANTYTGATAVNGGTLKLDFSTAGAPASSIISASSALQLADGTLEIVGKAAGSHTQTFGSTTVTVPGTLKLTQNGATSLDVNLGALTFTGGSGIDFVGGTGTASGARFITTTVAGGNDGLTRLGGGCRWNGTSWASTQLSGGTTYVVPWAGSYADIYTGTGGGTVVVPNTATAEVRIQEGGSAGSPNYLAAAATTINSLLMNAGTTASTIKMNQNSANDTLVVGNGAGANGAVRVASGAQGLTIGQSVGQGILTAGSSGASTLDLITQNASASQGIVVNSVVGNGSSASVAVSAGGSGGTVTLYATNTFSGNLAIGDGTMEIGGGGKLTSAGNYAGTIAVGIGGTLKYNSSANQTLSGVISGVGGLVKDGTGALELTQVNTYEGGTVINTGNLRLTSNNGVIRGSLTINANGTCTTENGAALAYGIVVPNRTVTINGGTLHKLVGGTGNNDYTLKSIDMTGGLISSSTAGYYEFFNDYGTNLPFNIHASASEAVISANLASRQTANTFVFTTDGGSTPSGVDLVVSGMMLGQVANGELHGITKAGAGVMAITYDNHTPFTFSTGTWPGYAGTTTISGGTLQLGHNNGTSGSLNPASPIVDNGTLAFKRGDSVVTQGMHFNSVISGTGGVSQLGSGTTFLTGANTYSGVTTITNGTLNVSALANGSLASPMGTGAGSASLVISGGTLQYTGGSAQTTDRIFTIGASGATLDASGGLMTLGSAGGAVAYTNAYPAGLTLIGAGSGSLGASLGDSGTSPNITSLVKSGSGTWTLTAANTFSGVTTVSNGKLYLNNANSGTTAISVAGGATLGGTGSAGAATVAVASSGTVEAGAGGAGGLSLNALNLAGGSIVKASNIGNYGATPAINVTSGGGLSTAGSVTIKLAGTAPVGSGSAHVLQYSGAIGGAGFAGFNPTLDTSEMTGAGVRSTFTLVHNPPYVDVNYSVDYPVWKGAGAGTWITAPNTNGPFNGDWRLASAPANLTHYIANDAPLFDDTATGVTEVNINAADVSPGSVIVSNSALAYSFVGNYAIAGSGPVIKRGTGLLTVSNTNKFTGQLTVEAGTLAVSSNNNASVAGPLGNSALPVILGAAGSTGTLEYTSISTNSTTKPFTMAASGEGVFQVDNTNANLTLSGNLGGSGGMRKTGAGTLALSGANNVGITTVSVGTMQIVKKAALYNGTAGSWSPANIVVESNAVFAVNVGDTGEFSMSDLTNLLDNAHLGGSTATKGLKSGAVLGIYVTNAVAAQTYGTSITNMNNGTNRLGFIKQGSGTLNLAAAASYTGGTIVDGGTLSLTLASASPFLGNVTVRTNALFQWTAVTTMNGNLPARTILIDGGQFRDATGGGGNNDCALASVTMNGGAWTQSGTGWFDFFNNYGANMAIATLASPNTATISANLASRNHTTMTFTTAAGTTASGIDLLVSGQLRADAGYAVVKEGPGVMAMTAVSLASTYSGGTRVNAGTFLVDLVNRDNVLLNTGALTLGGGTFKVKGKGSASSAQTVASLTTAAGTASKIAIDANAGGANTTTLTITSAALTTAPGSSVNIDYTAGTTVGETVGNNYVVISGSTPGLLGTAYTVTDSGGTGYAKVLPGGYVVRSTSATDLPQSGALGTINYSVYKNVSSVTPGDLNLAQIASQAASMVDVDTKNAAGTLTLGATVLSLNGLNVLSTGVANTFGISASAGGGLQVLNPGGTITVVNNNGSPVTLSAPVLDNSESKLTLSGTGTTILSGNSTYLGRTTINSGALQIGNAGTSGSISNSVGVTDNGTLVFNRSDDVTFSIPITGTGALTKNGGGTLSLAGVNSYSGATAVNLGTLLVNSVTGTGTGTVTVASGATLGGSGTVGCAVTVQSGGHLAAGASSVGTLTLSAPGPNLALNTGAVLDYEIGGTTVATTSDKIDLTGAGSAVTFGSTVTVNLSKLPGSTVDPDGKTFILFDYNGVDPVMPVWNINYGTTGWSHGSISVDTVNKRVILTGLVIPRPGTAYSFQ